MEERRERGLKKLPDGRWQWSYQDPNGEYHRHRARTKSEARAYLEKVHTEIREGRYLERRKEVKTRFEEAVKRFLEWSKTNTRPATHENDVYASRFWLAASSLAGRTLDKITAGDVERFRQELAARAAKVHEGGLKRLPNGAWRVSWCDSGVQHKQVKRDEKTARAFLQKVLKERAENGRSGGKLLTKRTVDVALARLKRFFNLCVEWELCQRNPAAKVKLFRADVKRVRFLTADEEKNLIEACDPHLRRIVRFALQTGARKGEISGLRWRDVDLKNGVATIPAVRAKAGKDRHLHLNAVATSILRELPRPIDKDAFVFANSTGGEEINIERHWRKAICAAGVEDFRFHNLRHTYASRLVMAGVDLAVLRELLGHADFTMTLRYAPPFPLPG